MRSREEIYIDGDRVCPFATSWAALINYGTEEASGRLA